MNNLNFGSHLCLSGNPLLIKPATTDSRILADNRLMEFTTQAPKLMNDVKAAFMFGNNRVVSEAVLAINKVAGNLDMNYLCDMLKETHQLTQANGPTEKIEFNIVKMDSAMALAIAEIKAAPCKSY